jgi:hypothetical protein
MNAPPNRPTFPGLVRAFAQISVVGLLTYGVWLIDPKFESKAHGAILMGLAFLFVIQDTLVGSFRKRREEAMKLTGIRPSLLGELFEKLTRLSDLAERMWWAATVLRGLTLVAGLSLIYGNWGIGVRATLVLCGYVGTGVAFVLCLRTYMLYRHVDSFVSSKEQESRINGARSDSAAKLEASVQPGWDKGLKKDGYDKMQITAKA